MTCLTGLNDTHTFSQLCMSPQKEGGEGEGVGEETVSSLVLSTHMVCGKALIKVKQL